MNNRILKSELNSPSKFKEKHIDYIKILEGNIKKEYGIFFSTEEIADLLLSVCRINDFKVIDEKDNKKFLNDSKVIKWIKEKLIPNIVIVKLDDEDVLRLLIFSIEITYQMFSGGTRATITQKGFRERRRTFESILADQFVGKLGEIMVKKFLEKKFNIKIELDWEISTEIEKYRKDIINAEKRISIKTSTSLAGIWAEADMGYDFGITVKCSVPQHPILQFFIEVCGFTRLLNFAKDKIPSSDIKFKKYLSEMRCRIKKYKCGEIQTQLKGFICGYFKTSDYRPVKVGEILPFLGKVREKRYLISIDKLKYKEKDWKLFLQETGLL